MAPNLLFVYGTLLPGLAPPAIADVVNRLKIISPATVKGRLYHLGQYPGCHLDPDCTSIIQGQLLQIPDPVPPILEKLDWYEAYVAHDAAGSLFVRQTCRATLPDLRQVEAWVYVYNRDVTYARLIESGRYDPTHYC